MENKNLVYFLAGIGTVSILIWGYNKFVSKPKPVEPAKLKSIVE